LQFLRHSRLLLKLRKTPLTFKACGSLYPPLKRKFMKRILLFVLTNLAVMVVLGVVASLLGVNRFLTANGLNLSALLGFSLIMGFGGAFISLLMSKPMAKWSTGARVINQPASQDEAWIVSTVQRLSERAGITMPEVAIYEGEPNAFATGAFKNSALVAVSTGLLQGMTREEIEAVLGHEIAHVANGDMVTLTLIQGVLNTFVVFLSRVVGYFVDSMLRSKDEESTGPGMGYYITSIVMDILLGFVASMVVAWFSRQREFRADEGAAQLMGNKQPMINALARLNSMQAGELPTSVAAMGITGGLGKLFASHPPLEERIAALQAAR
jgi:heat shock protein HtpX